MAQLRETVGAAFAFYDADGSGAIDAKELRNLVADLGGYLTDKELATALTSLDRDGNGAIDEHEFTTWWTAQSGDLDGDGHVGELERAMERVKASGHDRFRVDLHSAAWRGAVDVVQRLVQDDAELVREADASEYGGGNTPLHYAAYQGQTAVCEALLAAGAKINAVNAAGCTPLFLAAQQSRLAVVALLLEHGADIRIAERQHQFTAVDVCSSDAVLALFRGRVGGVPCVPDAPRVVRVMEKSIVIEWTTPGDKHDQIAPISGYKIRAVPVNASAAASARAVLVGALPTQYTVDNLEPATTYTFQLAAINLHGISAFSAPSEPTRTLLARPRPPSQLRARSVDTASIELSWAPGSPDNAVTHFIVQQCVDAAANLWKVVGKVADDAPCCFVVPNLLDAQKYWFRFAAVSATAGQSDFSSPIEARTCSVHGDEAKRTPCGSDVIAGRKARAAARLVAGVVHNFRADAKAYPLPENAVARTHPVELSAKASGAKPQRERKPTLTQPEGTTEVAAISDKKSRPKGRHRARADSMSDSDEDGYVYYSDRSEHEET